MDMGGGALILAVGFCKTTYNIAKCRATIIIYSDEETETELSFILKGAGK